MFIVINTPTGRYELHKDTMKYVPDSKRDSESWEMPMWKAYEIYSALVKSIAIFDIYPPE